MAAPEEKKTTVVETVFKAVGLEKLTKQWDRFGDALMDPILVLASGGTKAQAAWSGFRAVMLAKVMGPLGMVAGAATGFLLTTRLLVKEWRTLGLQSAKAIETLTLQFKPLFQSLDLAKKRAREVFSFSVKSPFKFGELAEGNKILQSLTKGALAGKDGMTLVGDAAAVAGEDFASMSRQVGRLYDGLMSGRPVGEAAFRLQELGVISGATRNQIEAMQAANASGSAVWEVARQDIMRAKGAMDALSSSLAGLESTYEDTRTQLESGFGSGFMEGEKAGVKSATQVMERLTPTAQYLGEMIGTIANSWQKFKAGIVDAVTAVPGFSTAVSAAALAVMGLAASITAAAGGMMAKFLLGVISAAIGNKQLAAAAAESAAAQAAQTAATGALTVAQVNLAAASTAVARKEYVQAAAHTRVALAQTVAAVRTNALAASQVILRGALTFTARAALFLTRQLIGLAVAIMATPAFWIAAALVAAGAAMLHFHNEAKKAREEMEAFAAASKATASALRQQEIGIRTVADLRKAEADTISKLSEAYRDLYMAQDQGDTKRAQIAREQVKTLGGILSDVRARSGSTELDASDVEREDALKQRRKEERKAREDDEAGRGEFSAVGVARRRKEEGDRLRKVEEQAMADEKRLADERETARWKVENASTEQSALEGKRSAIIKEKSYGSPSKERLEVLDMELAALDSQIAAIRKLQVETSAAGVAAALASGSELTVLAEKIKIYEDLKAAKRRYEESEAAWSQRAGKSAEEIRNMTMENGRATRARQDAQSAAGAAGVDQWSARDRQNAERRVAEIKATRDETMDPAAAAERERALRDAELALAQGRLETESQVLGLRLRGYEREVMLLNMEQQRLELARARGRVDEDSYVRQKSVMDARRAETERQGAEKREELAAALQISSLQRREQDARRAGDPTGADALRARADALAERQALRDARREAEDMGGSDAERQSYVSGRVAEEKARRDSERRREAEDRALEQDRSREGGRGAVDALRARVEAARGNSAAARRIREDAARRGDELDRRDKAREYRDRGFGGREADGMAARDVKSAQAARLLDELTGRRGSVIASSLAQVGGGGAVAGNDPSVRLQERMVSLLEQVADNTKEGISREEMIE